MSTGIHAPRREKSTRELVFLGAVSSCSLLGGAICVALMRDDRLMPPAGPAILFAIGVATLVYAFLDGQGDKAEVRGIRFGGAAAVFAVVAFVTNSSLETHVARQLADRDAQRAAEAASRQAAERAVSGLFLLDHGEVKTIPGGGSITLVEMTSSRGDLDHLRVQPNPDRVLARLVQIAGVPRPPGELRSLTPAQWRYWYGSLRSNDQRQIRGTPFAHVIVTSSDGRESPGTVFRGETITVLNRRNRPEATLCVRRVLNVPEEESDEREVLVLTNGPCRS